MECLIALQESLERKTLVQRGDRFIWLGCLSFLCCAFLLEAQPNGVYLNAWKLPEICIYKSIFAFECWGCGLTRSVVFAAHLDFSSSYAHHILGIPLVFLASYGTTIQSYRMIQYYNSIKGENHG